MEIKDYILFYSIANPVHINVMASTFIYKKIINSIHRNAMTYTLIKTIMN